MKKNTTLENRLLILCIISEAAAYFLALLFRYVVLNPMFWNPERDYGFYKAFFVVVVFFYWVVFLYNHRKRPAVREMDAIEQMIDVFKQHLLLMICLTLFLYYIHASDKVSRTVMGLLFLYGILFDLIVRLLYVKRQVKRFRRARREQQVLLLALEDEAPRLAWCIERYGYNNEKKENRMKCLVAETVKFSDGNNTESNLDNALQKKYDMIYLSAKAAKYLGREQTKNLEKYNTPICQELAMYGAGFPAGVVISEGERAAVYRSLLTSKCPVLGVEYTTTGRSEAAAYLLYHVNELRGKYVCFSNVHTTVMAADDPGYKEILNGAAATFPDGKPVADQIFSQGYSEAERVSGPDIMDELFKLSQGTGKKHYFYGSTEKTLEALKEKLAEKYPYMEVAGMYSPPFRDLTEEEDAEIIERINASGADFVWVGLGAPKQEKWMAAHQGQINGIMLGVGAGFDFHAGTVKRAPKILQKLGLEWLYRLLQDPKRLMKRYFITNTKFILYTTFRKSDSLD